MAADNGMDAPEYGSPGRSEADAQGFTLIEVARHLQVNPETLRSWNRRFGNLLVSDVSGVEPRYASADIAVLTTIQTLLGQGFSDDRVVQSLRPQRIEAEKSEPSLAVAVAARGLQDALDGAGSIPQAVGDVLAALANGQQTVLNSQVSMREMVSVVVQDNFNLKDENRKLRDRMLELERVLAEYQRREETRKERMEARLRALEGTLAAMQQQLTQFVQVQRIQQQKRRGWW